MSRVDQRIQNSFKIMLVDDVSPASTGAFADQIRGLLRRVMNAQLRNSATAC